MQESDWQIIAQYYDEGIKSDIMTFQPQVPDWQEFIASRPPESRIVGLTETNEIFGWACLSQISKRHHYRGVQEVSICLGQKFRHQGLGKPLLQNLINLSESLGIWALHSSVFNENQASIKIHLANGFKILGIQEKIAQMQDGRWRDTTILYRRSPHIL